MERKRIFIADEHISSKQNGVGTYMQCMLDCLKGLDVEVNLISFNSDDKDFTVYEEEGLRYYCFPVFNNGNMLESGGLYWPLLKMYVEDDERNVFFVNHSPCVEQLRSLRKQYPKSRIVFTIHDQGWTASLFGNKDRLREIIHKAQKHRKLTQTELFCQKYFMREKQMYRLADEVVCLSETTRHLLEDTYQVPAQKIHLIRNGFPMAEEPVSPSRRIQIRQELGLQPTEQVLLFVGRTAQAKGIDDLLKAFDNLWPDYPNLRLVIAGEVFRFNDFARLTTKSASHITYTGLISREQLQKWYQASDIGVLPSYTEQCSYTGMEMMANGLLVISTDGNGLTDMFQSDYNAMVASVRPDLATSLEETLRSALSLDQTKKASICRNAINTVRTRYSLSAMREGYRQLLS